MLLLPDEAECDEAEVGNFRAAAGECEAGEDPSDFSYLLVPEGERETRRSDSLSAILVEDRLLAAAAGEGDGERERTTEARCGTTTPMEALRSYLDARSPPPPSSSALRMSKRGTPRGAVMGELGAEEGCVAYLDCARLREKMADGFGGTAAPTVSRCGDSLSAPPNLEGERCLAALSGLGDSLVGVVAIAGGVSFGGVGLRVGNAIRIGDLERAAEDDLAAGDKDLPAADLGGSPNRESSPLPPAPQPPSLACCVRLPDLDLDEASEAAFGAPRCTEVTYFTPWLMSLPHEQRNLRISLRTSLSSRCS